MNTFAGIEKEFAEFDKSAILLQSIPYDGTSTWGKGADNGFEAFMEAAENMEIYDIETNSEVYKRGIHVLPELSDFSSPEDMYLKVLKKSKEIIATNKFPTFFGGEHSVSIGIIEAMRHKYSNLTVLQLDAHADLRPQYHDSPYSHACAVHHASKTSNLVQVGIRSMDSVELPFLKKKNCFFASDIKGETLWHERALSLLTQDIYLTIDLDVFDPSIMPATGTPEPGGLDWYDVIRFLKKVFINKNIVGFDIVELAPIQGRKDPQFLTSKLYYQLLSYKFELKM